MINKYYYMNQYNKLTRETHNIQTVIENLNSKVEYLENENQDLKNKINELIGITNNLTDYMYLELRTRSFVLRIGITSRGESILLKENTTEFTHNLLNSLNLSIAIQEIYFDEFAKLKWIKFLDLDLFLNTIIYKSIYHKHEVLYNGNVFQTFEDKMNALILIGFFDIVKDVPIKYSLYNYKYLTFDEIVKLPQYMN